MKFKKTLENNRIETIILGGSFRPYFNYEEAEGSFFIKKNGDTVNLNNEDARKKSIESFIEFVKELSRSYEVIVVSNAASASEFSPTNILGLYKNRRSIPLSVVINNDAFKLDSELETLMDTWFKAIDITFINQSKKVCPNKICLPLTKDGRPKYKDSSHMRPFYVIEHMDILDQFILLDNK